MTKHILLVDDEPNVRLGYRVTLETEGWHASEAGDATEALLALSKAPFDLAILDLRLPEMDGISLLAEMRNRHFNTPVVIITAYGDVPNAVRAMKLGAIDFLQKPLTPKMLRAVVDDVLLRHAPPPVAAAPQRDDFHTHLVTAKRLINLQDFVGAKEHIIRALEINTNSAEAFNLAGVLHEMRKDYETAKKYYGKAIKLDKDFEPAQQNMRRLFDLFNFGSSGEPFNLGD
jgi:DNA-binding NtrC family response regulator